MDDLDEKLESVVRATWVIHDPSHDISHLRRVRRNALEIAERELSPVPDREIVIAAVWLHDLVEVEKNDPRRSQASRMAA